VTPAGELEGRVALVTGASRGIGAAVARRMVVEGAAVVAADVHPERTAELAADVGSAVTPVGADVSEEEDVRRAVETAEALGGLEILVNVAGIGSTTSAPETPL
jgi:NAD(P)-dependent dehydrogenase (short-subunit alcohol dehydrogenase family)